LWLVTNAPTIAQHVGPQAGATQARAAQEVADLTDCLGSLAELLADGALDPADYAKSIALVRIRLAEAKRRAVVSAGKPATARLLSAPEDIGAAFDRLVDAVDPEPLRVVLREVLDGAVVSPERGSLPDLNWSDWTKDLPR
jgi:hypothetical protein